LALPESIHDRLLEQFPVHAESLAKELGFTAECFTNREARFLCGLKQEIVIERLVATAREMNLARQRVNPSERGINLDPS
jgi:hypothetical protein